MRKTRKKNRSSEIVRFFKEAVDYLKSSLNYIYLAIGLFLAAALVTFVFPSKFVFLDELLREIAQKVSGLNLYELIVYIFQNNFSAALFSVLLGVLLGVFPIMNSISNGAILGYVFARVFQSEGLFALWRILPHGIFELPAIFISFGLGIKLGFFVFAKDNKNELLYRLDRSLKVLVFVVLPLLIIAAIVEGILIAFF